MKKSIYTIVLTIALFVVALNTVQASIYFVATDGSDDLGDGGFFTPWATPQYAINQAADGDLILLYDGIYSISSTLTINKEVEISGVNITGAVIDAANIPGGYGILVENSNVGLYDFELLPPVGPGALGTSSGGGYAIHATFNHTVPFSAYTNLVIENVTIENGNRTAFDIHGYDGVELIGLTANGSAYGNGIQLTGCTDVTLIGCSASGNAWGGLAFYASKSNYLDRACSAIDFDLAENSIADVYVEDEFGLVNSVVISGAAYQVDNVYSTNAAMHRYTAADAVTAAAIADLLNTKYGNTESTVLDIATGNTLVSSGLSIIAAVSAASPGDTILINAGTYTETGQLIIDKDLTLTGAGAGDVTILPVYTSSGGGYDPLNGWIAVSEDVEFNLSGVTIDGAGQTIKMAVISRGTVDIDSCVIQNISSAQYLGWGVCILDGTNSVVANSEFYNIQRIGVHVRGNVATPTPVALIENCLFVGKGAGDWVEYGVEFGGGGSGQVIGCTLSNYLGVALVDGSTSAGILATDYYGNGTDATITSNSITGNSSGIMIGYDDADLTVLDAHYNLIVDNDTAVSSTPNAAVDATLNYFGGTAPAVDGPVAYLPYYTDAALTTLYYPVYNQGTGYASIQAAIDAASASDTITVDAGTFVEDLTVDKELTLEGANAGIDAVNGTRSAESLVLGQISVSSDNIIIDGVTLSNPNGTVGVYAVNVSGLSVQNNIIAEVNTNGAGSASGIYVKALGANESGFTIVGNNIYDIGSTNALVSTKGIYFGDSNGDAVMSNVLIQSNRISAVNVQTADWPAGKGAYGILLNYGVSAAGYMDNVQILDNIIDDIEGLWVHGIGLETDTQNTVVQGNMISNLTDHKDPTDAMAVFFEGNASGGTVDLSLNSIYPSAGVGVGVHPNDLGSYTVDASANYWGQASGPAAGQVSDGVVFNSYYTDPTFSSIYAPVFNISQGIGYLSIRTAVAAAAPGDTIEIEAGTYTETGQLVIDKDITIVGAGAGDVTILPVYTSSGASYDPLNGWIAVSSNVVFNLSGVTIDGAGQNIRMAIISRGTVDIDSCVIQNIKKTTYLGWGVCILDGTNSVVRNSEFYGIERIGVHVRGAVVTPAPEAVVSNCLFVGKGAGDWVEYGVEFGGGGSGQVIGCTLSNYLGVALSDGSTSAGILATDYYGNGTDATITSNSITGNSAGIMIGYADADLTVLEAHYNLIADNDTAVSGTSNVVVDASLNYFGSADPDLDALIDGPIGVLPYYTDAGLTTLYYPVYIGGTGYITIQDAIDAAFAGETITVLSGTFVEDLTVDKEVTLAGANAGIDAVNGTRSAESLVLGQVLVSSDNVLIDGITLSNPNGTVGVYAVNVSGLSVQNNIIADVNTNGAGSASGIYVKALGAAESGFTITGNDIYDIGSTNATVSTKGIYFGDSNGDVSLSNILIQSNRVAAVSVNNTPDYSLGGRGAYGILLNYGVSAPGHMENIQVLDNTITGLEGYWVHGIGLETDTQNTVVQGNVIDSLSATYPAAVFFEDNPSAGTVDLSLNSFYPSAGAGVALHPDDVGVYTVDASANYWGQASGPAAGQVSDGVVFNSYYTDPSFNTIYSAVYNITQGTGFMSIQAAIAAAVSGDVIEVSAGSYSSTSTITIDKELTVTGAGSLDVELDLSGCGSSWGLHITADNVTVEGMTLLPPLGPGALGTSSGGAFPIHVSPEEPVTTNSVPVQNLVLRDLVIEDSNRAAFDLHGVDGALLETLIARNSAYGNGIQLTGCSNIDIIGCTTEGNVWGGIAYYVSSFMELACTNVTFDFSANFVDESVYVQDSSGLTSSVAIQNASYRINNLGIAIYTDKDDAYAIAIAELLNTAYGNTLSTISSETENVQIVVDGMSIKAAVAAASAGDTIQVGAGTYDETGQIFIDKDLNIVGADRATTLIRPTQDTEASGDARGWFLVDSGVEFNLASVTLDGTGQLVYQGIRHKGHGTITDVAFNEIKYNESGPHYSGVAVAAFGDGTVDISNCTFDEIGRIGVLYFGSSLSVSTFVDNTYTGKGPGDWLDYGLDISAGANVVVSNNVITDCSGVASSDGSTSAGVMATTYFGPGTGAEVIGNTITNSYQGITVGYDTNDASVVNAAYNNLSGNDLAVVAQENSSVDATLNYFGSDDPDFAALIEGPVTYDPWFIDEALTQLRTLTVYVDATYTDMTPGWGYTNFATIQSAVDTVGSRGTVVVNDGSYAENLNLVRPATLVSVNGQAAVTITGSAAQAAALGGGNVGTLCVSSPDVAIGTSAFDGFTIMGYDVTTPAIEHAAIYLKSGATGGLSVMGNHIIADGEAGLLGQYGTPSGGIEVGFNAFSGQTYVGSTVGGNSGVQFSVHNVPRSMIYFSGNTSGIYFHDNLVGGSVGGLIDGTTDYYYNSGATLDCNAATDLTSGAVIENNIFAVGSWAALRARGPYSTVQNNTFVNTSEGMSGISVSSTADDVYGGNIYEVDSGLVDAYLTVLPGSTVVVDGTSTDYVYNLLSSGVIEVNWSGGTMWLGATSGTLDYTDADILIGDIITSAPTHFYVPSDFATIQEAVAAASDGDTIYVAAGSYASTATINIDKALTLIGEGSGLVDLDLSDCGQSWGLYITADNVTVEGMTLLPPLADPADLGTGSGGGFTIHATPDPVEPGGDMVENLVLRDIVVENGNRTPFDLHGVDGATLENLVARNSAYGNGINITGCIDISIVGCVTQSNAWGGVAYYVSSYMEQACSNVTFDFAANSVDESVYVQDGSGLSSSVAILNASYSINNLGIVIYTDKDEAYAAAIAGGLNAAYGNTLSTISSETENVQIVVDGMSIKAAVAAASAGDTIQVGAGTYDETGQIFIDKDLNIIGTDRATTIIRPTQDTEASGDARGWFMVDSGVELNLESVTLDGTGHLVYQGIRHKGHGTITDVAFNEIKFNESGPTYGGVAVAAFGDGTVDISNCTFDEIGRVGVLYFGSLVSVSTFADNTYTGKGPGDWLDYCLDISAGANVVVSNNVITGCSGVASSDGSTSAGVLATTFFGSGTGAEVVGNTISNSYQGIVVGYDTNDASVVNAEYNNLSGNDLAVAAQENSSVDATLNYFGSDDPDFAAIIDGPVTYDPWFIDVAMTELRTLQAYVDDDFSSSTPGWGITTFASLQSALAASASGATINVAAGIYTETGQLVIDKDITIVGAGAGDVTILPVYTSSGGSYDPLNGWIAVSEDVEFNLSGVTIDGAGQTIKMAVISRGTVDIDSCVIQNIKSTTYLGWGICILDGTNSVVRNSEFYGIERIGVHIRGNVATPAPEALVENCLFVGKGAGDWVEYGVEFGGGGSGQVIGCTLSNYLGVALSDGSTSAGILATDYYGNGTDATIVSNSITGNSSGIMVGYNDTDLTVLEAHYNLIADNDTAVSGTSNVVVDASLNYFGSADPDLDALIEGPIGVLPYYIDAGLTTLYYPVYIGGTGYITIQDAIDAAFAGETVTVLSGTFVEDLTIDKELTIEGANAGIDAVNGTRSAESLVLGQISVSSDNVIIDGITLSNPDGTIGVYAVNVSGLSVQNNIIAEVNTNGAGSASGIYVKALGAAESGFTITGNNIYDIGSTNATVSTKGIYFGDSNGDVSLSNILIQSNRVAAVSVNNTPDYSLGGRGAYGILLNYGVSSSGYMDDVLILDNTITGLEGYWVHGIGLETDTQNTVVQGNVIDSLSATYPAAVFFEDNPSAETVELSLNSLYPSAGAGVALHPDDVGVYTVDASANYWGQASGPAAGQVSDGVLYNSYYTDPSFTTIYAPVFNITQGIGYLSIRTAVAAAAPGDTIEIEAGTYTEAGQLVIDKDITIVGAGAGVVTLLPVYTSSGGNYDPLNGWIAVSSNVVFNLSGVTVDGAGQNIRMAVISRGTVDIDSCVIQNFKKTTYLGWGICILDGTNSVVRNSEFYGIERIGVHVRGAVVTPAPEAVVSNCLFVGKGAGDWVEYGVEFGGGGSGQVIGCTLSNYLGVALSDGSTSAGILATDYYGNGTDATITSNSITGNSAGIMIGYADADLTVLEAHYNLIADNDTAISGTSNVVVDASLNYFGSADPDLDVLIDGPIGVLPYYTDAGLTTLYYPVYIGGTGYITIQDAIDAASAGETVTVLSGTFVEDLTVDKEVTLAGANAGIDAVNGTRSAESLVLGQISVSSDNVLIDGITLSNPDGTIGVYAVNVSGLSVQNNIIADVNTNGAGSASGIYVKALGAAESGFTITGNDIYDIGSTNATVSTKGIYFGDSNGDVSLSNILIQSNRVAAVSVNNTPDYSLGGRGAYGILLNYGVSSSGYMDDVLILDNTITGLEGYWVHGIGLETDTQNTVVQGNVIDSLSATYPAAVFFEDNPSGATVDLSLNSLYPSAGAGVALHPDDVGVYMVDASANYWGQASGPAAGQVSDGVVFNSYYTDPSFTTIYSAVYNITQGTGFMSIQVAIDAANAGDTLEVDVGIFEENITLDKRLSIIGSGSDETTGTVLRAAAGDSKIGVVNLAASGLLADPILLQDMRIEATGRAGISVGRFTEGTGLNVAYVSLSNVHVVGSNTNPSTEQERGLYVDLTSSLSYLIVENCAFDNLTYGWYFQKEVSADSSTVQYVTVSDTTFNHNNHKGIYAEKLSDAEFMDCIVADNGFDSSLLPAHFQAWSAGVDVNLKAGTYANLTFDGCIITGNAIDEAKEGVGITVKARDDASSYDTFPATVDNVLITGCTIIGNERGVRIGEPGKNNSTPTNVMIENSVIYGNIQHYAGSDGSEYGDVVNATATAVSAGHNYWGQASGPASGQLTAGLVSFLPYYIDEALTTLYAPVLNITQSTGFATVQNAVAAAVDYDVLIVGTGTYVSASTITIDKPLSLIGEGSSAVTLDLSAVGAAKGIRITADDVTIEGLTLIPASFADGGNTVYASYEDDTAITNLTLRDLVVDGSYNAPFELHGVDGVLLENLVARNAQDGYGIQIIGCGNVEVLGCVIDGNVWGGVAYLCSGPNQLFRACTNANFNFITNSVDTTVYVEDAYGLENDFVIDAGIAYTISNPALPEYVWYVEDEVLAEDIADYFNVYFGGGYIVGIYPPAPTASIFVEGGVGATVLWNSERGRNYTVLFSTNLMTHAFESMAEVTGTGEEMGIVDSEVRDATFYKVSVEY